MTTLRPSFGEREAFRSALSQAYADGRLDDEEFDRRATILESCVDVDDLRRALRDLPQPSLVFPKTVTKSDAEKWRRHAGRDSGPKLSRRAALGLGAIAVGFVAAGGIGQVFSGLSPDVVGSGIDALADPDQVDYLRDSAAVDEAMDHLVGQGYVEFIELGFYDNHLSVAARSPKNPGGIDGLSVFSLDDIDVRPSGQFEEGRSVFSRSDVNAATFVEMARVAPEMVGGVGPSHLLVGFDQDGLNASVYVEGDEYGSGSGMVTWSGDGTTLLSVSKS